MRPVLQRWIISQGVTNPQQSGRQCCRNQPTPMPCPTPPRWRNYTAFPALDGGTPQVCRGGTGSDSFNGKGQIDTLAQ